MQCAGLADRLTGDRQRFPTAFPAALTAVLKARCWDSTVNRITHKGAEMKPSKRIVAGFASAALVVGAGAGFAEAAQKTGGPDGGGAAVGGPPGHGAGPGSAAIASYLGLT